MASHSNRLPPAAGAGFFSRQLDSCMNATAVILIEFLNMFSQFIIPIDRRTHSWIEPQCECLGNDSFRTVENGELAQ